jgi:nicotinamide mononucleotide (NMN) deamidase PncC
VAISGGINSNYLDYVNISSKLFNHSYTSYNNNNKMQIYKNVLKVLLIINTSMDPAKKS